MSGRDHRPLSGTAEAPPYFSSSPQDSPDFSRSSSAHQNSAAARAAPGPAHIKSRPLRAPQITAGQRSAGTGPPQAARCRQGTASGAQDRSRRHSHTTAAKRPARRPQAAQAAESRRGGAAERTAVPIEVTAPPARPGAHHGNAQRGPASGVVGGCAGEWRRRQEPGAAAQAAEGAE